MQKVRVTFAGLVVAGLITEERATKWATVLTYLQLERAIEYFEVQLGGRQYGLRFTIFDDGSIHQDAKAGSIDFHGLPKGTAVGLYTHTRPNTPKYVYEELEKWGWGFNGRRLEVSAAESRGFSKDGYGIVREKLGEWPK
jgi:hypothetical protein